MVRRRRLLLLACLAVGVPSAAANGEEDYAPPAYRRQATQAISDAYVRGVVQFLAHDLLEGRAPGTRGDRLAQLYLATEFRKLGLEPALPGGAWLQPVPLVGMETACPSRLTFRGHNAQSVQAVFGRDYVAVAGQQRSVIALDGAELVFVGYGMVAPEYDWDDYKDADVRGKVVVLLNSDPADDPGLFEGKARTYYGRWDYKYAEAARHGAAAALVIHTTESAGYPWGVVQSSWTGEQFQLRGVREPHPLIEGWITWDCARRVFAMAGQDLELLSASARRRTFRPVPLNVRLTARFSVRLRALETANVVGMVPGSTRPDEAVVYTAHFDHIGKRTEGDGEEDRIYNGALDNASGVAGLLAIARAFARQHPRPKRSILFAAVAAEEQGLLGSRYLATHVPDRVERVVACLNLDGLNIWGRTRDLTVIGFGRTTLDRWLLRVASWQGRIVKPDQFPDRGFYFRSDHFSFALEGIPAVSLDTGNEFIGRPPGWGREVMERWEKQHYHRPSDEYQESWNLAGAIEDLTLWYLVGSEVADAEQLPSWTSRFARPRAPK